MIFSELYGAYYNTVAAVLRKAVQRPLLLYIFPLIYGSQP